MKQAINRTVKSFIALILAILMCSSVMPTFIFADEAVSSVLTSDITDVEFKTGELFEFTFTTTPNDDAGKMVRGYFEFSDISAIEVLQYMESKDGLWYDMTDSFGPDSGFPMMSATSRFRVKFNKPGKYSLKAYMKEIETEDILCEVSYEINVAKTSAVMTNDVSKGNDESDFFANEPREFSIKVSANDDKGALVKTYFIHTDPDVVSLMEFKDEDGEWHEFDGVYGSDNGYALTDDVIYFRFTYNKIGAFGLNVHTRTNDEQQGVICSTSNEIKVGYNNSKIVVNLPDEPFDSGELSEFSVDITSNSNIGKTVFATIENPADAVSNVMYRFSENEEWKETDGINIASDGFVLTRNTKIYFKASYTKVGTHSITIKIIEKGEEKTELCSANCDIEVIDKHYLYLEGKLTGGKVMFNGKDYENTKYFNNDVVNVTASPYEGYAIQSVQLKKDNNVVDITDKLSNGKLNYNLKMTADTYVIIDFIKVYSVKVKSDGKGKVTVTDHADGGEVIAKEGENIEIIAKADENYRIGKVLINGEEDKNLGEGNISEYTFTISVDKEYSIEVLFMLKLHEVKEGDVENGKIISDPLKIEYGSDARVDIIPDKGYTVKSVSVDGVAVSEILRDEKGIYINVKNVTSDITVDAAFVKLSTADINDITIDTSNAIRSDYENGLFVFTNDGFAVFSTTKDAIRLLDKNSSVISGDLNTKEIKLNSDADVAEIQLFYKTEEETIADWHSVADFSAMTIAFDTAHPELGYTFDPEPSKEYNFHNSDVNITLDITDPGYYSGLSEVSYWINGETENKSTLFFYEEGKGTEFKNTYSHTIPVDSSIYNTSNVKVTVYVIDRAGNNYTYDIILNINTVAPQITADLEGTHNEGSADDTFTEASINFTIIDRSDTILPVASIADAMILKRNGKIVEVNESYLDIKKYDTDEGVFSFSYVLSDDGYYEFELNYSNKANMSDDKVEYLSETVKAFYIDNNAPYGLGIEEVSEPSEIEVLLNVLSFGYIHSPVKFNVYAKDSTTEIVEFRYLFTPDPEDNTFDNYSISGEIKGESIKYDEATGRYYATVSVDQKYFNGNFSFEAFDAGRNSSGYPTEYDDNYEVFIDADDVKPEIEVVFDQPAKCGSSSINKNTTATITVTDERFVPENTFIYVKHIDYSEATPKVTETLESWKNLEAADGGTDGGEGNDNAKSFSHSVKKSFTNEGKYLIAVRTVDAAGNINNNTVYKSTYNNSLVTIDEKVLDMNVVNMPVDKPESDSKDNADKETQKGDNSANNTDTPSLFEGFDLQRDALTFVIDKQIPSNVKIFADGNDITSAASTEEIPYMYFSNKAIELTFNASHGISGKEFSAIQISKNGAGYNEEFVWSDPGNFVGDSYTLEEDGKYIVYYYTKDQAGNARIVNSLGIIIDHTSPVIANDKDPKVELFVKEANSNGLYSDNLYVGVNAYELTDNTYSGLKEITYEIVAGDTGIKETGVLFAKGVNDRGNHISKSGEFVIGFKRDLLISKNKFNSNSVSVTVTATDNAGNSKTARLDNVKIDTSKPVVNVSYNNNAADNQKYFKNGRIATVNVNERNFDPKNSIITVTGGDGNKPVISGWSQTSKGSGNRDNATWTATVNFAGDGDYTIKVEVTDLAGNKSDDAQVNYSGNAVREFTVDTKNPVVQVSFNNSSAVNGKYYNSVRTATVVITEHNLDPNGSDRDRIQITSTASSDGKSITAPAISRWTTNGDRHTASITYSADADYVFDIDVTDKAGNKSDDKPAHEFTVDVTKPEILITGIENKSANKGEVIPVIRYSDVNLDSESVKIIINGANRGELTLDGTENKIHNGAEFTFNNFPYEKDYDDIYTLDIEIKDKAGNTNAQKLVFSVNRFGSAYSLDETTQKLNGTYVYEAHDVVIHETNADELSNIKLTLFKNNETVILTENEDYKVELEGGDGEWYMYTYTVFAKNFDSDGVYSIVVEADDKAGNVSKNDLDTKNTSVSFGIDKTYPIINIENIESDTTYASDSINVNMSIKDNLKLSKVVVELDGKTVKEWLAEELEEVVNSGGNFSFTIKGDSNDAHKLVVYAVDEAGNGDFIAGAEAPENAEIVDNFFVTTDLWTRFYNNKPLFFGSIAGIIVLGALTTLFIVRVKKNKTSK